jgi:hypothetical protein
VRYVEFDGLVPKRKPQMLGGKFSTVAHNLDIMSGRLESFGSPVPSTPMVTSDGQEFVGTAKRLYKCAGMFVAWDNYVFVAKDTQGTASDDAFLFVDDGSLFWQGASQLASKLPAVKLGICPPTMLPTATILVGQGCPTIVTTPTCVDLPSTPPDATCSSNISTEIRSYVYTYIRKYSSCHTRYEESVPSDVVDLELNSNDAVVLSAGQVPVGIAGVRWYRAVAGEKGVVWLEVGESVSGAFVDTYCVESLGEPLLTESHFPPPSCIEGVANLGDALVVVWSGRKLYVSEPRLPYAYDLDIQTYDLPYDIVGIRGVISDTEQAQTYQCHILTTGTLFSLYVNDTNTVDIKEVVGRDGQLAHLPCVSVASVTDLGGSTGYASPYGFISFSGNSVKNLTENYLSEKEWQHASPSTMRCAYWHERVFITSDNTGFVLGIAPPSGTRSPSLVTHDVAASAWCVDPTTTLHLAIPNDNKVYRWGEGVPMQWAWQSESQVQEGLWRPSTIKIISGGFRKHHDNVEAKRLFTSWVLENKESSVELFFCKYPEYLHLRLSLESNTKFRVLIFCDGRIIDNFKIKAGNSDAVRIKRKTRGIEWAVRIEGDAPVREVHLQTSATDLSQEGGAA